MSVGMMTLRTGAIPVNVVLRVSSSYVNKLAVNDQPVTLCCRIDDATMTTTTTTAAAVAAGARQSGADTWVTRRPTTTAAGRHHQSARSLCNTTPSP